ncbi:MAG TPA: tyrosine-type recombinase/integrase, partial [Candidatus Hydrogenedentes bacterium]|nr:tyrosine-type recombinase/integrase [Candidatus Hydrogenedentota bacterium]
YAASLNSFCNWCIDRDYMEEHPLKKLKRFDATPKTVRRAITPEEIARLLEVAPEDRRILYETAFCSGLRAKELKSLTVHDLDLRRGGLHLHAKWTKNRMAGFQPLPSAVLEHLSDFFASGQAAALYRRNHIRQGRKPRPPVSALNGYMATHADSRWKSGLTPRSASARARSAFFNAAMARSINRWPSCASGEALREIGERDRLTWMKSRSWLSRGKMQRIRRFVANTRRPRDLGTALIVNALFRPGRMRTFLCVRLHT